jgi:aspartate/methionine/tyrosine aminotransferase
MNDIANRVRLASRMDHIEPFEAMEIQTLARELEAQGRDVIHLEIGEPDFTTPEPIVEAARRALDTKPLFYTSAIGLLALREAIAGFYRERYRIEVPVARIVVTAGSSAALLLALGVLLDPEDEVLLADPGYPCNRHFVRTLGGVPRLIAAGPEARYQLSAAVARRLWSERTRVVMVASPSNPTGSMVTPQETRELAALAREKGGTLLMDEIYHGLVYEDETGSPPTRGGRAHTALEAGDDVFVINSFSKYFQMTGWRLGWLVAPAGYVREIETLAQNLFISPSALAQYAALACFEPRTLQIAEERRAEFDARRKYLVAALETLGFRVPVPPQGAYYIYADCSQLAADSFAFAREILVEAGVAVTPGKDFGLHEPHRHLRIAYVQSIARLEEAIARIRTLIDRK